ncbi:MAG: hypothetical protein HYX60_03400 [Legionella longbeachae]|nr:hypothetical protein [Legionella longbeachae]
MTRDEIIQTTILNQEDLDALLMLEKAMQAGSDSQLTAEDKKFVLNFLENSIANMELNKQLLELGKLTSEETGIGFAVINTVKNVTFKSRRWQEIDFDSLDKITLSNFGVLSNLASLCRDLAVFNQVGLLTAPSDLSELYSDAKKAQEMVERLEKQFFKDFITHPKAEFLEIKPTKGALMFPHAHVGYRRNEFDYMEFLYSEEYRVKLEKLIDPDLHEYLKKTEHLGENWLQHLEHKFAVIQRELHDVQLMGPIDRVIMYGSSSIKDDFYGEKHNASSLICSSFVGICTIAAIKELNDAIIQELKDKGAENIPATLICTPFSNSEKLKSLSPENLLSALDKYGALERVSGRATRTMKESLNEGRLAPPHSEDSSSIKPK